MKLNSFCVIVSKYGLVLHHERPMNINRAKTLYYHYINLYFEHHDKYPMHIGGVGYYSDEFIDKKIREWKGNLAFVAPMVISFGCSSEQRGVKVELKHSSI